MNGNHLKYMLLGGAGLFGVLLAFGLPLQSAVLLAILLACPLMMLGGGHGGHGAGHSSDQKPDQNPTQSSAPRTGAGASADTPQPHRHH